MTLPLEELLPDPPRLDRHETYVGIQIYVWVSSIGIYLLPLGTGPIASMDAQQQKLLAICMFIGSTLCLSASAMGTPTDIRITKPFRWVLASRLVARVRHHPYAPLPVRHCYRLGVAGLSACIVSFMFFSATLVGHGSIIGSMTGLLPPILTITWYRKARKFWRRAAEMDVQFEKRKRNLQEGD